MDPSGRSPWAVLGVDEHATLAEVQHAFRIKAKQTHPDHGGDRAAFERVRAAFEAVRPLAPLSRPRPPKFPGRNPYAWLAEPMPARVRRVATASRVMPLRPSAVRFADVLRTELDKLAAAA